MSDKRAFRDGDLVHDHIRHETIVYNHRRDRLLAERDELRPATEAQRQAHLSRQQGGTRGTRASAGAGTRAAGPRNPNNR